MLLKLAPILLIFLTSISYCSAQHTLPDSSVESAVTAFQSLLEQKDDRIETKAKAILSESGFKQLLAAVVDVRKSTRMQQVAEIQLEGPTKGEFGYELADRIVTVSFELSAKAPIRVTHISIAGDKEKEDIGPAFTWENFEDKLDQAADDGFAGVVLVTRKGELILHRAYGFANQAKAFKNSTNTVFAIGSAPIDFTHAGILLLSDDGKLNLSDPITKFFENVPSDKKTITIGHLMTGASGLENFHDIASDKNTDHTWIDRDEAVRRILAKKILFEPGNGNRHSHSAWGLLAAIIEIASGQSYADFTKERLFSPAGMNDTGFFGEPVSEDRIAVGYGGLKSSEPNTPPHWGPAPWLVMGSGGQISTLGDMRRWIVAIHEGKILSVNSTRAYLQANGGIHANGDAFGFEFVHSSVPEQMFMIISNNSGSKQRRKQFRTLWKQLHQLTKPESVKAPFSLGVELAIGDSGIVIRGFAPKSAAQQSGMKVNDQLTSANGIPLLDSPVETLGKLLQDGKTIEFKVLRDGQTLKIRIDPRAKKS